MVNKKIDKDYLFKTVVRILGEEMHFDDIKMRKSFNILTNIFEGIDFISSEKNMLSTERCKDSIILKNFEGCKKMGGIKDSSIKQYVLSVSSLLDFCNKELISITTDDIRRYLLYYEKKYVKLLPITAAGTSMYFFNLWKTKNILKKILSKRYPKSKKAPNIRNSILI